MYSSFQLAVKYLSYYCTASNGRGHGIHSPFIFKFITDVLNDKHLYDAYQEVEELRKRMLLDDRVVNVEDFGAGSAVSRTNRRSVSSIAKNAAKPKKYGQFLFRMVNHFQPKTIIELGTSLGITSTYLSLARPPAKLVTMEGSPEIAAIARENFENLSLKNIELVEGNFDDTLGQVTSRQSSIDLAFIDGNHRKEPTERYFTGLKPKMHNDSMLIFDDIHWSREMEAAWSTVKEDPVTRCTIDLFFIGIVFFREEFKEKQHFVIRF